MTANKADLHILHWFTTGSVVDEEVKLDHFANFEDVLVESHCCVANCSMNTKESAHTTLE